jgi:hypothetical protein
VKSWGQVRSGLIVAVMGQIQLVTIQPHTSLNGAGSVWPVGRCCTFMKKTFVSENTNLNGSRFSFLKRNFGFGFKTQTSSGMILGSVFFCDENLSNFDLKNIILTQWIFH